MVPHPMILGAEPLNPSHLTSLRILEDKFGRDFTSEEFPKLFRDVPTGVSTDVKFTFNDDTSGNSLFSKLLF